ncbi:hypothetical protein PILCRDRAFT_305532 [Piloderma croceum F 1598]|uniref:Uncharacterized protein n=1 Tax=Piloderma croceum (strain F 1598) TaxID=765440 RepID=A0A0C3FSR2_PILCF|nr:hypothetical protein PILCRDRAFT_305532 [Piloderma croceum F 1598]
MLPLFNRFQKFSCVWVEEATRRRNLRTTIFSAITAAYGRLGETDVEVRLRNDIAIIRTLPEVGNTIIPSNLCDVAGRDLLAMVEFG